MIVVGNGFIAKHFLPFCSEHPHVLVFTAGVSKSGCTDEVEFRREVDLFYAAIEQSRADSRLIVYFSTSSDLMYNAPDNQGVEDKAVFPRSAYGRHKLAMEAVLRLSGVRYLILRVATPAGSGQKPYQLVPSLCHQVQQGIVQVRQGTYRDLIDIDHVVQITRYLLEAQVCDEVINVASGHAVLVDEIVDYIAGKMSTSVLKNYIDQPNSYKVSIKKLQSLLGAKLDHFQFNESYYQRVLDKVLVWYNSIANVGYQG